MGKTLPRPRVAGDIHWGSLLHLQTKDIPCVAPSKGMLFPIGLTWGPWRDQIQNKRFGSSRFLGPESSKENQHTETSQSNSKPTSKFVLHHFDPFFWGFGKNTHTHPPTKINRTDVCPHLGLATRIHRGAERSGWRLSGSAPNSGPSLPAPG